MVEMSLVVAVVVCSMMAGAGGSWTSVGGVMWWWSLVLEAGASGGMAGMMSGAGAVGAEEVRLESCASVGDAMWW